MLRLVGISTLKTQLAPKEQDTTLLVPAVVSIRVGCVTGSLSGWAPAAEVTPGTVGLDARGADVGATSTTGLGVTFPPEELPGLGEGISVTREELVVLRGALSILTGVVFGSGEERFVLWGGPPMVGEELPAPGLVLPRSREGLFWVVEGTVVSLVELSVPGEDFFVTWVVSTEVGEGLCVLGEVLLGSEVEIFELEVEIFGAGVTLFGLGVELSEPREVLVALEELPRTGWELVGAAVEEEVFVVAEVLFVPGLAPVVVTVAEVDAPPRTEISLRW